MHPLLLPSIDDGEKEHGMSKRYRETFLYLVSFLDQIPIMLIGLSSVLDRTPVMWIGLWSALCLLLAWKNIPTFSLDIIKPSLARTFPSVYEARWISRGIQSLACLPFVRSFMGQWLAQLVRYHLQSLPSTSINVVASGLVLSSSLERLPRQLDESSINCIHGCFLPSIDDGEKEHGMSKHYRKHFSIS